MQVTETFDDTEGQLEVPAFLGLNEQQSRLLVALYNETDPEFAKQVPTALPVAAQQLAAEYEKRNSVGKKLERAHSRWSDEFDLFDTVQQEAVTRLSKSDMNIDKAAEGLTLESEQCPLKDLLLGSLLYGGLRRDPATPDDRASMSPVASPNFEGAKHLLERAFSEHDYTMAAVQIGSFYTQEDRLANGKNLPAGQDAKRLAYMWYAKAAEKGNPMACHKVGFFLENGVGCDKDIHGAVAEYTKAFDQGYPDSAHNLGILHQGNTPSTLPCKNTQKSLEFFESGKQWGYAPSANALGRMYLLMSKDERLAKEAGNPGTDKDEYIVTGIDYMEDAANNGDADAMLMLGLIFGSQDYGLYDMDKAQNYLELALVRGDVEAFQYLVRVLRAKMAARVALEKQNMENFEKLADEDKAKLIRQLAKEAAPEKVKHQGCGNIFCENKETDQGSFKRCGQCQRVAYCSRDCQRKHWKAGHSKLCTRNNQDQPTTSKS
ncbi:HCP-like protein [Hesseltinella vesiculosa]|uniref:HCP-like protein n=1 Tax=Hesseltinella vesiculosa TaxID=101127 RepID=A0A1X2GLX9_9FUNG|nr:HCP-like protein [Hesseltinella vesiculosa]